MLRVRAEPLVPAERKELLTWLANESPKRLQAFLESLSGAVPDFGSSEFIDFVSERFEDKISEPKYSVPFREVYPNFKEAGGQALVLSQAGSTYCCDAGLLLARLLIDGSRALHWAISAHDRKAFFFSRPVVSGFAGGLECEPFLAMMASGQRIINAQQRATKQELSKTYRGWLARRPA